MGWTDQVWVRYARERERDRERYVDEKRRERNRLKSWAV